jgi:hypothetical protein
MQAPAVVAATTSALTRTVFGRLQAFVQPLVHRLDERLDARLVRTFVTTLHVLLQNRYRAGGLLLTELGALLTSPDHAAAGTKRLSNLLRSDRWSACILSTFLWDRAEARLQELVCRHERPLVLWDESVWEKPESIALEGLCSVRSSEAERLKRVRKGYYSPPAGKVFVPGMQWLSLLLIGRSGPPMLAAMRWWTTRGGHAEAKRDVEAALLEQCAGSWGKAVTHIFDRGFAGAPWLEACARTGVRFVMRWPTRYHLWDVLGRERPAWQMTRGKPTRQWKSLWDSHVRRWHPTGVVWVPVHHPAYPGPLWLVVSRRGPGKKPWYLLTNEYIDSPADAWDVILAYARRWQIEMAWRFVKHELAMESPRLWKWENRQKLLLMVSLVYAFLLTLLSPELKELRDVLLRRFCPRTGKRSRDTSAPLYRLRIAICYLWSAFLLDCARAYLNSG